MRKFSILIAIFVALAAGQAIAGDKSMVLVEAESFQDKGGWVVDQQSMDQMGSAYLLAHGLGDPVKDAVTTVRLPCAGTYRVWVRTWDWVSPWNAPGAPGKFQVVIDGVPLKETFGEKGKAWGWQGGQTVEIRNDKLTVALHDLTGFEGRCDAVLFSADVGFSPPQEGEALVAFRRTCLGLPNDPPDAGRFDLVVTGGGVAGICTAITAARLGLAVALIQDRPVLGGNSSSEIGIPVRGNTNQPPFVRIGDVVREIESLDDGQRLKLVQQEKNIRLFLNMHVYQAQKKQDRLVAVMARHIENSTELRFSADLFADCTGDGNIGFLAGADFRIGREGRNETGEPKAPETPDNVKMGSSLNWKSVDKGQPVPFVDCPWALVIDERSCIGPSRGTKGSFLWETGYTYDAATQTEFIRDYMFRAIYGTWDFQKNRANDRSKYANRKLSSMGYMLGKRESRRLLGDVILTEQDIRNNVPYEDACLTSTWGIDLHTPHGKSEMLFPGNAFICTPSGLKIKDDLIYPIPYRCLYSRNVNNLFMAGRHISVTHVALGQVRVQGTTGMMGEVVGRAAAICKKYKAAPRAVYEKHLAEFKDMLGRSVTSQHASEAMGEAALRPKDRLTSQPGNQSPKPVIPP